MIATARERADARTFAHVMDVALELPLFTPADLAEHFDVAPSTINKWRSPDNAPQDVLREVVMDELCATLDVLGGDYRNGDARRFERSRDLAMAGRREMALALRRRLDDASALTDSVFVQNMRAAKALGLASLETVVARIEYSEGSLKRWLTGANLPNGLTRRGFNRALRDEIDRYLERVPVEA